MFFVLKVAVRSYQGMDERLKREQTMPFLSKPVKNCFPVAWRVLFALLVIVTAVLGGVFGFFLFRENEVEYAASQFVNRADSSLDLVYGGLVSSFHVSIAIGKAAGHITSNSTSWPNVALPGFYDFTPSILDLADLSSVAFMPIVDPVQLTSFETFLKEFFQTDASNPPSAGQHHFGFGVFATDPSNFSRIYHDTRNYWRDEFLQKYQQRAAAYRSISGQNQHR